MADAKVSDLTAYTAPLPDDVIPIVDVTNTATKKITYQNLVAPRGLMNYSTANQATGFATDTYVTGSNITMPSGIPDAGTHYEVTFAGSKTAAGTATPIVTLRFGTGAAITDTALCAFTFSAGTAATDNFVFTVRGLFRTVGSGTSAVVQGVTSLVSQPTTGTSLLIHAVPVTSAGFNSTTANAIMGVSLNAGASAVWTLNYVRATLTP